MTGQLTRSDLAGMSPEEIEAARLAGQLDALLGIPPEETRAIARARAATSQDATHTQPTDPRSHPQDVRT